MPPQTPSGRALWEAILAATAALTAAEPRLTDMDQAVGDGDLGISLARGAQAVQAGLSSYPLDDPAATLHALGLTCSGRSGGTSGPLYAVFFLRAARRLAAGAPADPRTWAAAFRAGCEGIMELGGARPGDRTMLDALVPASEALQAGLDAGLEPLAALREAARAARAGAKATALLSARRGRSSYLGERVLGCPDPGAVAVAIWLRALIPPLLAIVPAGRPVPRR
jgi:dihydroxyacetone kinase